MSRKFKLELCKKQVSWLISIDIWAQAWSLLDILGEGPRTKCVLPLNCWHQQSLCKDCWSFCSNCPLVLLYGGQTGSGAELSHLTWILCLTSYHSQSLGHSGLCKALGAFAPFKTRTSLYPVSQREFSTFLTCIHVFVINKKKVSCRGCDKDVTAVSKSDWLLACSFLGKVCEILDNLCKMYVSYIKKILLVGFE